MADLSTRAKELRPGVAAMLMRSLLPVAGGVGFAFLMHWIAGLEGVRGFPSKLMMDVGINIVLAVSLTIVNGFTGQFSIGHAGFMAVGGYTAGAITYYGSHRIWDHAVAQPEMFGGGAMLFLGACLAGGLLAAILGFLVGLPSLRLRGDYLAIVTLGFGEIVRVLLQRSDNTITSASQIQETPWYELATHLGGALGFFGLPFYTSNFWVYLWVALTLIAAFRLKESSYGRAFLAIRENEIAAEAMGVATTRYKVLAFVVAAFFAGVAGALYAHEVGTTLNAKELGFQKSFDIIIMVVLGGMGSISGSVLAAIVLTLLPEWLRDFQQYRMVMYAGLLITMMLVRPSGIFGLREVWDFVPRRLRGFARFDDPAQAPLENPDPNREPRRKGLQ